MRFLLARWTNSELHALFSLSALDNSDTIVRAVASLGLNLHPHWRTILKYNSNNHVHANYQSITFSRNYVMDVSHSPTQINHPLMLVVFLCLGAHAQSEVYGLCVCVCLSVCLGCYNLVWPIIIIYRITGKFGEYCIWHLSVIGGF